MDSFLRWLGGMAGMVAIFMCVPAAYIIAPQLMAVVGMMPWEYALKPWNQAQPFVPVYIAIWIALGVLYGIGRSADERIGKKAQERARL